MPTRLFRLTQRSRLPRNARVSVTVYIATSVDGFIARKDGDIGWLHEVGDPGEGVDYGYEALIERIDALVMGRLSYEKVLSLGEWPYSKPVVVLSSSPIEVPEELKGKVEITLQGPTELVARLAERGWAQLYIDGGRTIRSFLQARLVDELTITTIPHLLGQGLPLFGGLNHETSLKHVRTESWRNGLVQSTYEVVHEAQG